MRRYTGGYARTTVHQNLVLRWVRDESIYEVWRALSDLELGDAGAHEISDTVSCPGTDSCKLGITSSMGLNQAIQDRITAMKIDLQNAALASKSSTAQASPLIQARAQARLGLVPAKQTTYVELPTR